MGILDDAIREHLELRRRGGADSDELQSIERLVSGTESTPAATPDAASAAGEPDAAVTAPADIPPLAAEAAAAEPAPNASPEVVPAAPAPAEPEAAAPHPAPGPEPVEQPTRSFTAAERDAAERPERDRPARAAAPVPDADAADPAAASDEHDELEDTPDFLQETPEHERLWFEQKPPKDFDF